jgi:protein O-mannosyl-transferase
VGVIAYSNSFDCSFHLDDFSIIANNSAIRNLSDIMDWWKLVPTRRAIGYLSFALNYRFNGLDVWGYHLVNLAIHIFNSLLVWWLVMLTMATPAMRTQPISRHKELIALFTALLFVSHPLATQSVTYIVQRLASLATLFYFLSLALYVKGRLWEGDGGRQVYFYYAGSLMSATLGMLTKEIVFTLPFALLLYEFCFIKKDTWKINLKDRGIQIPLVILVFLTFVVLFYLSFSFKELKKVAHLLVGDHPITAWEYLLTQFSVILTYIRLFILPINQNLDYDYPISHGIFEGHTLFGLLSLAGIFVFGIFLFRKYRLIAFGIFWFFLTPSVQSSIIPIQDVIFEHRTYLPSFGFFLVLTGASFYFLYDRYKYVVISVMCLMILACAVLTYERNKVWQSEYTLWADCVKKSPHKPRPMSNYGKALADIGRWSEALIYYNKAIAANPLFPAAYDNRGSAYVALGNFKQAIMDFDRAIAIQPNYANAYYDRGTAYIALGNYEQAIGDFDRAIAIKPDSADYYNNRGAARAGLGNYKRAISDYDRAIAIKPDYADYYNNRGAAYAGLGNYEQAISDYDRAIEMRPNYAQASNNRGIVYARLGRYKQAISDYDRAIESKPDYAEAYNNRSFASASLGNQRQAIEDLKKAASLGLEHSKKILRSRGIDWQQKMQQ